MSIQQESTSQREVAALFSKRVAGFAPWWPLLCQLTILAALLFVLYAGILRQLVQNWTQDPNYSHAFLVPLFAAYLIGERRREWRAEVARPAASGLLIVAYGAVLLILGDLGAEFFLSRVSLLVILMGVLVYFQGWRSARILLVPWLVLFLMIPLPSIVFNEIAFPLQIVASTLSTFLLKAMQVPVVREGNIIDLPSLSLNVVEACSGIRSLMSLVTLALFYGLIVEKRAWRKLMLVAFAVPTAVVANALRIVGAALLGEYVSPKAAEGFFHLFSGWLLFVMAVAALIGLHSLSTRFVKRSVAA